MEIKSTIQNVKWHPAQELALPTLNRTGTSPAEKSNLKKNPKRKSKQLSSVVKLVHDTSVASPLGVV